jgi:FtsH-binding integral membrane protein
MSMFPQSGRRPVELEYGTTDRTTFNFFNAVYAWMAVGLAVTAVVGWGVAQSPAMLQMIYGSRFVLIAAALGLFAIAMATQRVALKMSAAAGTAMFLVYAGLMGVFISYIFVVYKLQTLGAAFLVTGGVFGLMSVYGYVTKRDLTTIGSYCVMGLMGLFVASLVNVFLASNALSWIVTYGVVLVTIGIIAYKTQDLKAMAAQFEGNRDMLARISIIGALILYISFINLFLSILRIMGNRR